MEVRHFVTLYLTAQQVTAIPAMQGDGVRLVVASLMEGADPWEVPEGTNVGVGYTLPDKTEGYYDRLDSGEPAAMAAGNLVSVVLAPALTQQAGTVKLSLILRQGERQIATFPLQLRVQKAAGRVMGENVAVQRDGFDGKIYYGGPGGTLIPLGLGGGVRVEAQEDGTVVLVGEGGSGGGIAAETDPTVPQWAKQPQKPAYTAQEVGADPAGSADTAVTAHEQSRYSHYDIRQAVQQLQDTVNLFLDVDDSTQDSLSEVLALIDENADVIDQIITGKISKGDIVNDLLTEAADKPLSAAQGVVLKTLIDGLVSGKLDADKLTDAIASALENAAKSGEFDGAPGAAATLELSTGAALAPGAAPTVTELSGSTAQARKYQIRVPQGERGPAYELTEADKDSITQAVIEGLPKYAGEVTYG